MKINIKAMAAAAVLLLLGLGGVTAYCAVQGKYLFQSEPQLERPATGLPKVRLAERQPLDTTPLRDRLATDAQLLAYDTVEQYVRNADSDRFQLDGVSNEDMQMAVSAFRGDHPEVFWLDPQSCYKYYDDGASVTAELNFTETGDALETDRQALQDAVQAVAAAAPDNADDYEIELYLNDWLIEHCAYHTEADERHTALGALVLGEAVCDGYARAFQLLCRQLGVECLPVEGTSDFAQDAGSGHMWNVVQLGGSWYHTDVTWNDAPGAVSGAERYFYLNLTTAQITRDHVIGGSFDDSGESYFNVYVPDCDSDALHYMHRTFVTVKNPEDDAAMVASLLDAARRRQSYCAFLLDEGEDFAALSQQITEAYAAEWVRGANLFLNGNPTIAPGGGVVTYESKRVLVLLPEYQESYQT